MASSTLFVQKLERDAIVFNKNSSLKIKSWKNNFRSFVVPDRFKSLCKTLNDWRKFSHLCTTGEKYFCFDYYIKNCTAGQKSLCTMAESWTTEWNILCFITMQKVVTLGMKILCVKKLLGQYDWYEMVTHWGTLQLLSRPKTYWK